jgi:hypothetical protein
MSSRVFHHTTGTAAALIVATVLVGCKFASDYSGTHYACNPAAPDCPDQQVCSPAGVCVANGNGSGKPDGGTAAPGPDAAPGTPDAAPVSTIDLSFGERPTAIVQGVTTDTDLDSNDLNNNHGSFDSASFDSDPLRNAVLRFELSSVPPGTQVVAARLFVYVFDPLEDGDSDIATVAEAWSEANANYLYRGKGNLWAVPGGTVNNIVTVFTPRTVGDYEITLPPATLQDWIDHPGHNDGLLFNSTSNTTRGGQWRTREYTVASQRPMLVLTLAQP